MQNRLNRFPNFPKESRSLLSQFLTPACFEALKDKKTTYGYTLFDAIRSGIENPDSSIGVYAGDSESYTLFSPLFDPIIKSYHHFTKEDMHHTDFNPNHLQLSNLDPQGTMILSTRIRVARNLTDYPLGPAISKVARLEVAQKVTQALNTLTGTLKGVYYPLEGMSQVTQKQLTEDHFLFKEGDRFLESAGLNRDWPSGRGIFHNREKTFLVWVNEEDQLRIISMQKGGDIKAVFERLSHAIEVLQKRLDFAYSKHLGYLTSCPTNLGTAMRASVHIKLPHLAKRREEFESIVKHYHLQIRGVHGEHSESKEGIFDISNRRRLGITEVECVQEMYQGVKALIKAETALS